LEPPFLLALDNRHFGTSLQSPEETNEVPFQLAEGQGPQMEPLPVLSAQSSPRAQSAYHIEGPLAGRPFGPAPTLPSWPTNQLLKNSVVEFAVNPSGEVVLQRLLSRSGAAAADMQAVALTRGLRFLPLPPTNPPLTWSKAIFQWQTVDPTVK
jgi:TonB family protein